MKIDQQIFGMPRKDSPRRGFTLLEVLTAMTVLIVMLSLTVVVIQRMSNIWKAQTERTDAFANARSAFQAIESSLSQAILNTYWDYERDSDGNLQRYDKQSELHFISRPASIEGILPSGVQANAVGHLTFFQAPLGYVDPDNESTFGKLENLVNIVGFYIEHNADVSRVPSIFSSLGISTPTRYRYRLYQVLVPAEENTVYADLIGELGAGDDPGDPIPAGSRGPILDFRNDSPSYDENDIGWAQDIADGSVDGIPRWEARRHLLAENIIMMVLRPKVSPEFEKEKNVSQADRGSFLAPDYVYDSKEYLSMSQTAVAGMSKDNLIRIRRDQLPPIVEVVIFAISEEDAIQLEARFGSSPYVGPGAFIDTTDLFEDAANLNEDIDAFENQLVDNNIEFRIFRTDVVIRSAFWDVEGF